MGRPSIQGIVFNPDGGCDINYAESDDINPKITIIKQAMISGGVVDLDDLIESIQDILDEALAARYDDPSTRIVVHK